MSHGAKDWLMVLFFFGWFLVGASNTLAADAPVPIQSGSDYCDFQRAGNPECIAWRARPSNGPGDAGYYVGGGAPFRGEARTVSEGTWGWDYQGPFCFRRIDLGWWHGARSQGGAGQYQPDRMNWLNR